jgi:hypothetical protein
MAVSQTMVQTKVDTNKHGDFDLVFTNHRKEDEMDPLGTKIPSNYKEIAKAQNKDQ